MEGSSVPTKTGATLGRKRDNVDRHLAQSQVIDVDEEGDRENNAGYHDKVEGIDEWDEEDEQWSDPGEDDGRVPDELDPHELYEQEKAHAQAKRQRYDRHRAKRTLDFPPGGGDLAEFFGDIDPGQQISICRAYASYLAAQNRARKPGYPSTYIKRSK